MFALHPQLRKDSWLLADLPLSSLLLSRDAGYPWLILVPRRAGIREIFELSEPDQQALWQESAQVARLLQAAFSPDKLNIAALGNMVPQLHLHHIARFETDAAWPAPVWGKVPAQVYDRSLLTQRLQQLQAKAAESWSRLPTVEQLLAADQPTHGF